MRLDRVFAVTALLAVLVASVIVFGALRYQKPNADWPKQSETSPVFEPWVPVPAGQCPPSLISDLKDPCKRAAVAP